MKATKEQKIRGGGLTNCSVSIRDIHTNHATDTARSNPGFRNWVPNIGNPKIMGAS